MIVRRIKYVDCHKYGRLTSRKRIEGWYLFGIIPLYIKTETI